MTSNRSLFDEPSGGAKGEAPLGGPLAERMRPATLDEMVGQGALVGPEGFLRRAIAEDRLPSLILWGPAGSGKTTLARIVASSTSSRFVPFSAVTSGIKEVKQVMQDAARLRRAANRRSLLFVDEIHRFNRAQQDAFLPYVESGDIVLVGATTENPSFELNSALLSRCKVVVLEALSEEDLVTVLGRALADEVRGLGGSRVTVEREALVALARLSAGDARRALNLLELTVRDAEGQEVERIDASRVEQVVQHRVALYDKSGEEHFNLISALHKSVRESDPDAALYWLARMLAGGEDPGYLGRRLVRMAVEDIGLADPQAAVRALAGWQAFERLGPPEGELALAQVAVDLALCPKSNAIYKAWGAARAAASETPAAPVPMAIRNAPTRLLENLGYGKGYVYAPDTEEGVGGLECLPDALAGTRFYRPRGEGFEEELARRLERFRELRERAQERR
jgi:putative ATPase